MRKRVKEKDSERVRKEKKGGGVEIGSERERGEGKKERGIESIYGKRRYSRHMMKWTSMSAGEKRERERPKENRNWTQGESSEESIKTAYNHGKRDIY